MGPRLESRLIPMLGVWADGLGPRYIVGDSSIEKFRKVVAKKLKLQARVQTAY